MVVEKRFASKAIIKFLALLCFAQLCGINAELEFVRKLLVFPKKEVVYNDHAVQDENIVFAVCENQNNKKICRIVHQKYPYEDISSSCNFTFSPASFKDSEELIYMDVRPLGKDKALLIWEDQKENSNGTYVKLTTLNMSDCKISELQFWDSTKHNLYRDLYCHNSIVTYNDSFDIFLKLGNPYGNDIRQLRVDSRTGSIEELDSHMTNVEKLFNVFPIETRSPTKGYIYTEANENITYVKDWLVKSDGSRKLLRIYNGTSVTTWISAGNNAIGICTVRGRSTIECKQYDENGIVQSVTVLQGSKITMISSMHMSSHGGFLLLLRGRKNRKYFDHHVIRVNIKGKVVGRLHLEKFDNSMNDIWAMFLRLYDKDDGKYCITLPRRNLKEGTESKLRHDVIDIAAYCFTEDDLSMNFTSTEFID